MTTLTRMPKHMPATYDPMGTENITAAICRELERQPLIPLDHEIDRFEGSGLYAIYYNGNTERIYERLKNHNIPVYVGQAVSHNSQTGVAAAAAWPLWRRIRLHRKSIEGAGLLGEFGIRLLLLPDVYANLGENGLRVFYRPVWNAILTGFGSNEQGPSTRRSKRSKWDTVHSGRQRTHGGEVYDVGDLLALVRDHITSQLERYDEAPWH